MESIVRLVDHKFFERKVVQIMAEAVDLILNEPCNPIFKK